MRWSVFLPLHSTMRAFALLGFLLFLRVCDEGSRASGAAVETQSSD